MRPRFSLLDFQTTEQLVHAIAVLPSVVRYSELVDLILHHTMKFNDGEEFDRESGVHHSAAAAVFAYQLMSRIKYLDGVDDRTESEPKEMRLVWPEGEGD